MKNLIDPKVIEGFINTRPSYDEVSAFLESHPEIVASHFCKLINVNLQTYYSWKHRNNKSKSKVPSDGSENLLVNPVSGKNRNYTAEEKLKLVREYLNLESGKKTEFLRKFGIYQSDISKWSELAQSAALVALSARKIRSDKKSDAEIELEGLKKEIAGQEKTIAKLAALVVFQKKISEILNGEK